MHSLLLWQWHMVLDYYRRILKVAEARNLSEVQNRLMLKKRLTQSEELRTLVLQVSMAYNMVSYSSPSEVGRVSAITTRAKGSGEILMI